MTNPALIRMHVWVSGTVQGVWFRESTKKAAEALGVVGWVRNLPDRRVEGVFEGPASAVDQLVAWCNHGPERAMVTAVHAESESATGEFEAFRVLR